MAQLTIAAVDLGAESGRVVAGRFDGQTVELEVVHRFPNIPVFAVETLHWDVLRLWQDIQDGLAKVAAQYGKVASIGVDTWGVDFGLLDSRDELLGNPVHYRDSRTDGAMELAFSRVPRREIYQHTGLQFMQFNSLFQLTALQAAQSPQLEAARSLLFMPDLLNFWLTGSKTSEYSIASTSQMLNARSGQWDTGLINQLGLPTGILNHLVQPGTRIGSLRAGLADRLGLGRETAVVAPGCHDTASAVVAVPWEKGANAAYLSSGTWSLMGLELSEPIINDSSYDIGFTNEGGAGQTIRFLKNIAGLWLVQECRRAWGRQGREFDYPTLTSLAAQAPENGAFVEPDDARFGVPGDMPAVIQGYCRETGQRVPATEGEVVRCCLDSLALKYRWTFERLEQLQGKKLDALHIVGGGTQNKLLSQLTADCLGRPVYCGPIEATAAGNVMTQAMGLGAVGSIAEIREVIQRSFPMETYLPDPTRKASWDERYGRFQNLSR